MRSIGVGLVFAVFSVIYAFESKAETVTYIHTDALGSVVAESDETGRVAKRYSYEPYGAQIGTGIEDGVGYAGHVSDSATGLSYMQQRYWPLSNLPSPVWRRRWHGGGLWDSEVHESRKANQQDRAGNCRRCWSCNWWYRRPGGWSPGERDDFDRSGRSNSSDGGCRDWCCGYGCTGRNRRNTSDKRSTGLIGCRRECWQFGGQRNWKTRW